MRGTVIVLALMALVGPLAAPVHAGEQSGWGVRFGLGDDPDQGIVGGQYDIGEVARHVHVVPMLELGFGDDHTVLSLAGIAQYRFGDVEGFRPYAGAGIEMGWIDHDHDGPGDDDGDDDDFEIQPDIVGGLSWPMKQQNEFFLELVLGFGDLHDVQIMAGFRF